VWADLQNPMLDWLAANMIPSYGYRRLRSFSFTKKFSSGRAWNFFGKEKSPVPLTRHKGSFEVPSGFTESNKVALQT
jgi:hypothetical protein